jgi:hypothetical protein
MHSTRVTIPILFTFFFNLCVSNHITWNC